MKTITFSGDVATVIQGIKLLAVDLEFKLADKGELINIIKRPGSLKVVKSEETNEIHFDKDAHFFRGLATWLSLKNGHTVIETPHFEEIGPMFDLSRNAVLSLSGMEKMLKKIAVLGMNSALLYMEDTYEIPEYPYFGYMRGRYTKNELKYLDNFAQKLGIELIPCIQTLAHLQTPLSWSFGDEIKDTPDSLLVGEEKTYKFIEASIRSVSQCFKTKKIHIGMDEALNLGLGKYLEKHGYTNRFDIFMEHLHRVVEIAQSFNLAPMIWSDMFMRLGSKTGYYYDIESEIPKKVIDQIPNVDLMYWDYYNSEQSTYEQLIEIHQSFNKKIKFAGGIWTFNGIAPNYGRTFQTTNAALNACKKYNINTVYATMWMDDGAETPIESSLLGLQLFAEHQFYASPELSHVASQFQRLQHENYDDFMLLDLFDQTPGVVEGNKYSSAISKLMLYSDLLLGLYDKTVSGLSLTEHYQQLYEKLMKVQHSKSTEVMFDFYKQLAMVLFKKVDLGCLIKKSYDEKDLPQMQNLVRRVVEIIDDISVLETRHRLVWENMNKTIGFEVLEIRYGGLINRLKSVSNRLNQWIDDPSIRIEELEYERLIYSDVNSSYEGSLGRNFYQEIVTPNKLSNFK